MPSLARRQLLAAASATFAGAVLPLQLAYARSERRIEKRIIFDPAIDGAQALAATLSAQDQQPLALSGDRLHFWNRHLGDHQGPVTGISTWSDRVLLMGRAAEQGLRPRSEQRFSSPQGRQFFLWTMA